MNIRLVDGWGTVTGDAHPRTITAVLRLSPSHRVNLIDEELRIGCLDAPGYLAAGGTRGLESLGILYAVPMMVTRP